MSHRTAELDGNTVVLKFGGTSVADADAIRRAVEVTASVGAARSVVVTSACAGVTNQLLECAALCGAGRCSEARSIVRAIRNRHEAILASLVPAAAETVARHLDSLLVELMRLVEGILLLGELTPRSVDAMVGFGERLSSVLLAAAFNAAAMPAHLADSREFIITDDVHQHASPLMDEIAARAPGSILPQFADHVVVVAQGFIGATTSGVSTTIGRGGSDHTAALLGAALGSREIQIWTDVSGILTADPRRVPRARVVREVTFGEARELAYFGAKVIHPDTILPAVRSNIPVVVRNSMRPADPGTRILPDDSPIAPGIHSITVKANITLLRLAAADCSIVGAMSVFDRFNVVPQCALVSERHALVAVEESAASDLLVNALGEHCMVEVDADRALLALVGSGLRNTPAVLIEPLAALSSTAVPFVAAGASDYSVLIAVSGAEADELLGRIHRELFE